MKHMTGYLMKAVLGASALALAAGGAHAAVWTLEDLNSVVTIDTTKSDEQAQLNSWTVNGVEMVYEEMFWYRIGNGAEIPLSDVPVTFELASDTNANPGDDVLNVTYSDVSFSADVRYSLQGSPMCCSDLAEQVTVTNLSMTDDLEFTLIEYTDFDLSGDVDDNFASFTPPTLFVQQDGGYISETIVSPVDRWEISIYDDLRDRLEDGDEDLLANAANGLPGPDDFVWAASWTRTLDPGASFTISKDKLISPVPLPAPALLLITGLAGLAAMRKRVG
jgi:hypothetical protein